MDMVESQVISITAANHADEHRHGGDDPLTGDVRINILTDGVITNVFTGASPVVWADLDLSAVVGAATRLVGLRIKNTTGVDYVGFRTKGDTDTYLYNNNVPMGVQGGWNPQASYMVYIVLTDVSGIVQWNTNVSEAGTTIDVLWYI